MHSETGKSSEGPGAEAFQLCKRCGDARTGRMRAGLETPAVLLYTRRGFPAPLTLRELDALSIAVQDSPAPLGMQVSAAELLDEPGAGILRKVPGGLKQFCGLHNRSDFLLLSARDSLTIQAGMPSSEGWTTLQTPAGQKKVTTAEYCDLVGAVQPDAALCLTDEVFADSNDKKLRKSVERSAVWTDECLRARSNAGGQISPHTLLFAPIVGGWSERERTNSAQEAGKRSLADGYAILGLGCGESHEARETLLKACLQPLDASKPRYISGLGSPDEVLWCAANGIDLIESTYPAQAAALGIALTFEVRYQELMSWQGNEVADNKEQVEMDERGARGGKLNLWDTGKIN